MVKKAHWENVYSTKTPDSVSWYQPHAQRSLDWIVRTGATPRKGQIIDIGGGVSTLVDDLLVAGYEHITVLDLSGAALRVAQQRLGARGEHVHWCEADVTIVELPACFYDVWHDRAVFHFLTEAADRKAYAEKILHAVKVDGHIIMATFSLNGPTRCSGLPIMQYSAETLQAELGPRFQLMEQATESHVTPTGATQHFIYCHFIKRE